MFFFTIRPDNSSVSSTVTLDFPRAKDSRSLTAARMSPLEFFAIFSKAPSVMSTFSDMHILFSAFTIVLVGGFLNVNCNVSVLMADDFLLNP